MRLHYAGKYNEDPSSLPSRENPPGAVQFREQEDAEKLGALANGIAVILLAVLTVAFLGIRLLTTGRVDLTLMSFCIGGLLSVLALLPHEFIHALCFREDVYLYTLLSKGLLFVVGTEDMTKARFVMMSLMPAIVLGFVPFAIGSFPQVPPVVGVFGVLNIASAAGDYYNVYNALTQMPAGALTYLNGFHSWWYLPET